MDNKETNDILLTSFYYNSLKLIINYDDEFESYGLGKNGLSICQLSFSICYFLSPSNILINNYGCDNSSVFLLFHGIYIPRETCWFNFQFKKKDIT